jgi:hypothetical protein
MSFKLGDKVYNKIHGLGVVIRVYSTRPDIVGVKYFNYDYNDDNPQDDINYHDTVKVSTLVSEEVYNSQLYQAMKE